jgi:hypothetical protein
MHANDRESRTLNNEGRTSLEPTSGLQDRHQLGNHIAHCDVVHYRGEELDLGRERFGQMCIPVSCRPPRYADLSETSPAQRGWPRRRCRHNPGTPRRPRARLRAGSGGLGAGRPDAAEGLVYRAPSAVRAEYARSVNAYSCISTSSADRLTPERWFPCSACRSLLLLRGTDNDGPSPPRYADNFTPCTPADQGLLGEVGITRTSA